MHLKASIITEMKSVEEELKTSLRPNFNLAKNELIESILRVHPMSRSRAASLEDKLQHYRHEGETKNEGAQQSNDPPQVKKENKAQLVSVKPSELALSLPMQKNTAITKPTMLTLDVNPTGPKLDPKKSNFFGAMKTLSPRTQGRSPLGLMMTKLQAKAKEKVELREKNDLQSYEGEKKMNQVVAVTLAVMKGQSANKPIVFNDGGLRIIATRNARLREEVERVAEARKTQIASTPRSLAQKAKEAVALISKAGRKM